MSISISGDGTFTGVSTNYSFDQSVSIGGTLTYEDVTNVDSIGIVTARSGVHYGTVGSGVTISAVGTGTSLGFLVNGSERVRIDSSGRLLVGTSSGSGSGLLIVQGGAGSSGADAVVTLRRGNTNPASGLQGLGIINFEDLSGGWGASIAAVSDGSWNTPSDCPTYLKFSTTADGESTPTERMRLDNNGRFMIGGTLPSSPNAQITAAGDIRAASFATGSVPVAGGSTTILTVGRGELYLLYSILGNYSGSDTRHGIIAFAGRTAFGTDVTLVTNFAGLTGSGAFAVSGSNITYSAGGGVPSSTVYYMKIGS
jgi:hypothetical protein